MCVFYSDRSFFVVLIAVAAADVVVDDDVIVEITVVIDIVIVADAADGVVCDTVVMIMPLLLIF